MKNQTLTDLDGALTEIGEVLKSIVEIAGTEQLTIESDGTFKKFGGGEFHSTSFEMGCGFVEIEVKAKELLTRIAAIREAVPELPEYLTVDYVPPINKWKNNIYEAAKLLRRITK